MNGGLRRLDRVTLVVNRARRAGQVVDLIDFDVEGECHVVPDHLEARISEQVGDVVLRRRVVVVDAQDVITVGEQPFAQVRADESGAARDKSPTLGDRQCVLPRRRLRYRVA